MPDHDHRDDLAALDFYGADESDDHDGAESDALDFSATDEDSAEHSDFDALDDYASAESDGPATELEAIDSAAGATQEADADEDENVQVFTVTNPSDTVSVTALMDGRTHRVELSPKVTSMTESELAEEIVVLADVAQAKGLAGVRSYLVENEAQVLGGEAMSEAMRDFGIDGKALFHDFVDNGMGLPTTEEAEQIQAEVFAARYTTDHD
jgi:hypothetical protein